MKQLSRLNYIDADRAEFLLKAYDFLKQAEICMRLIDLKPSSAIPADPKQTRYVQGQGFAEDRTQGIHGGISGNQGKGQGGIYSTRRGPGIKGNNQKFRGQSKKF